MLLIGELQMDKLIQLIVENRAWLFDGIGVVVAVGIVGWIFRKKNKVELTQSQKSGNNSINIQVGRDLITKDKNK